MLAVRRIDILIAFSMPIIIGIVRRPADLSPIISAASLTGEVIKIIVPSIRNTLAGTINLDKVEL